MKMKMSEKEKWCLVLEKRRRKKEASSEDPRSALPVRCAGGRCLAWWWRRKAWRMRKGKGGGGGGGGRRSVGCGGRAGVGRCRGRGSETADQVLQSVQRRVRLLSRSNGRWRNGGFRSRRNGRLRSRRNGRFGSRCNGSSFGSTRKTIDQIVKRVQRGVRFLCGSGSRWSGVGRRFGCSSRFGCGSKSADEIVQRAQSRIARLLSR